jgi:hypothetical protein
METQFQGCFCALAENFSAVFEYSYRSMFLQSFVKIGHSPPRSVPCKLKDNEYFTHIPIAPQLKYIFETFEPFFRNDTAITANHEVMPSTTF